MCRGEMNPRVKLEAQQQQTLHLRARLNKAGIFIFVMITDNL
jgi:hypothetical protein